MNLDAKNIGAYLLDLSEGRCTVEQRDEILKYLRENPKMGLSAQEQLPSLSEDFFPRYPAKTGIYAQELSRAEEQEEDVAIGWVEKDLEPQQQQKTEREIQSNERLQEKVKDYEKTVLEPEENVKWEDDEMLKRSERKFRLWAIIRWTILIVLIVILFLFAPEIIRFFTRWNNGMNHEYQPRTQDPIEYSLNESEISGEDVFLPGLFAATDENGFLKENPDIPGTAQPTLGDKSSNEAVSEPKKKIRNSPRRQKAVVKSRPTTKTNNKPAERPIYKELGSLEPKPAPENVMVFEPQYLDEVEIRPIRFSDDQDNVQYPANRQFRNNILDALNHFGGKRFRYVKRKDGSYKLEMELPFITIERTLNE